MKKTKIQVFILAVTIVVAIFAVGYRVGADNMRQTQWEEHREVITVTVYYGDTLWDIAEKYKPSWMSTQEYCSELKTLNGKSTSTIYAGEQIKVYA